jgi:hypothetical protein
VKHVNLLLSAFPNETLAEFASAMFEKFSISKFEERESENYVDGHYFVGSNSEVEFKVMKSDEAEHSDLPFWIRISAAIRDRDLSADFVEELALNVIKPAGRRVSRLDNFGQVGEKRIDY